MWGLLEGVGEGWGQPWQLGCSQRAWGQLWQLLEGEEEGFGLIEGQEEGWWQHWQLGGAPSAGGTCAAWRTASWGLHLEETGG